MLDLELVAAQDDGGFGTAGRERRLVPRGEQDGRTVGGGVEQGEALLEGAGRAVGVVDRLAQAEDEEAVSRLGAWPFLDHTQPGQRPQGAQESVVPPAAPPRGVRRRRARQARRPHSRRQEQTSSRPGAHGGQPSRSGGRSLHVPPTAGPVQPTGTLERSRTQGNSSPARGRSSSCDPWRRRVSKG